MAAPQFILKVVDGVGALVGDINSDGGLDDTPFAGLRVVFTPNVKDGTLVLVDGRLRAVRPFPVSLDALGRLNGTTGIPLLADDPSLGLSMPLQWNIRIETSLAGQPLIDPPVTIPSWWINAPADGAVLDLKDAPPVPMVETHPTGLTVAEIIGEIEDADSALREALEGIGLGGSGSSGQSLYGIPTLSITTAGGAPIVSKDDYLNAVFELDGVTLPGQVKGRGNSTWLQPKKPYRLKLTNAAALLGMPSNKNWALLANYLDPTMARNAVAFEIGSRLTGLAWTPRARYVEVVLNGVYAGLYQLTEIVKFDPARVNATAATGTTAPGINGAYLLEIDERAGSPTIWFDTAHDAVRVSMDDPDGTVTAQKTYIQNWLNTFETTLYGAGWLDPDTGYASLIDQASFVDWYLVNELLASIDAGFNSSCKLYKTAAGKLVMGPLWDYDNSMGLGGTVSTSGWWLGTAQPGGGTVHGATWFDRLKTDPAFMAALVARWPQIVTALGDISTFVDSTLQKIAVHRVNDGIIWGSHTSWTAAATEIKTWLSARIAWMTSQLTVDTTAPSTPTGLTSSAITSSGFTATWTASTDNVAVTGYQVRANSSSSSVDVSSGVSYAFTGLAPSTSYAWQVRARDAAGNWSAWATVGSPPTTGSGAPSVPDPVSVFDFQAVAGSEPGSVTSGVGGYVLSGASWSWDPGDGGVWAGTWEGAVGPSGTRTAWTVAFTVLMKGTSDGDKAIGYSSAGSSFWAMINNSNHLAFYQSSVVATTGAAVPTSGQHLLVYSIRADGVDIYLDGALVGSFSGSFPTNFAAGNWHLATGDFPSDAMRLRKVRFWDAALTADQVAAL